MAHRDGTHRFCVDYRGLNTVTKTDSFPLPRIEDLLDVLGQARYFSTLDLASGFWQIRMHTYSQEKTAFVTPQHLLHLQRVIERVVEVRLKLKPSKCKCVRKELEYLGHIVSQEGLKPNPRLVDAVRDFPKPTTVQETRRFLGLCSYYRKFIPCFAEVAHPLHQLTRKDTDFVWSPECQQAFEQLKCKLVSAPVLAYPNFQLDFVLETDASVQGLGAVLCQFQTDRKLHPVAYPSRALNDSGKKYGITELETLAVVWGISHFHHFLYGHDVTVYTDHAAVKAVLEADNPTAKHARWWTRGLKCVKILYRAGKENSNADALSRSPCLPAPAVGIAEDEVQVATLTSDTVHNSAARSSLQSTREAERSVARASPPEDDQPEEEEHLSATFGQGLLGEATATSLSELPFYSQEEDSQHKTTSPLNKSTSRTVQPEEEEVAMLTTSILSPQSLPVGGGSRRSLHLPPTPPRNISIVQTDNSVTLTFVYRLGPTQPSQPQKQIASVSSVRQTREDKEVLAQEDVADIQGVQTTQHSVPGGDQTTQHVDSDIQGVETTQHPVPGGDQTTQHVDSDIQGVETTQHPVPGGDQTTEHVDSDIQGVETTQHPVPGGDQTTQHVDSDIQGVETTQHPVPGGDQTTQHVDSDIQGVQTTPHQATTESSKGNHVHGYVPCSPSQEGPAT